MRLVHNPRYAEGLSTSLASGLAALDDDVDAALVCLGDMPRVTPAHIEKLVAAFAPEDGQSHLRSHVAGPARSPGSLGTPVLCRDVRHQGRRGGASLAG